MSPKARESNLLWQNDVHRVLRLFCAGSTRFLQQMFPLLPDQLAVLGVSQPRLTAAKKHNARGTQDDEAGEQGQHAEADELPVGDQDARGMDRLLQGDLEQVSVGRSEEFVEGVCREGVMLRSQREHPVLHVPGTAKFGLGLWSVLQGTRGACKPLRANAPEGSIRLTVARAAIGTGPAGAGREAAGVVASEAREAVGADAGKGQAVVCAVASVEAGVRLAAVGADLAVIASESGGTHAGGGGRRAVAVGTRASILARGARGQSSTM